MHVYRGCPPVYHADLYRVDELRDFETLGLEDIFIEPGILIVEWAERFLLRSNWPAIRIRLKHLGRDRRKISVSV